MNCLWKTNTELRAVWKEIKKDWASRELCQLVHVLSGKIDRATCWLRKTENTSVCFSYKLVSYAVLHAFHLSLFYPCYCRDPDIDFWDGRCVSYTQFCHKSHRLVAWELSFYNPPNWHCLWGQVATLPSSGNGWLLLVITDGLGEGNLLCLPINTFWFSDTVLGNLSLCYSLKDHWATLNVCILTKVCGKM